MVLAGEQEAELHSKPLTNQDCWSAGDLPSIDKLNLDHLLQGDHRRTSCTRGQEHPQGLVEHPAIEVTL